jgi:hypothetical protein
MVDSDNYWWIQLHGNERHQQKSPSIIVASILRFRLAKTSYLLDTLFTEESHYQRKGEWERERERENQPDVLEAITMIGSMFRYGIEEQNHAGKTNIAPVGWKIWQPPDMLQTKTDVIISGRTGFEGRKIPLGLSPECYCRDSQLRSLRSLDTWRKP